MKYLIVSFILLLFFASCDDRLEGFIGALDADFSLNNGIESDSVKIGLKSTSGNYAITVSATNIGDIASIKFDVLEGNIDILQDGLNISELNLSSTMNLEVEFKAAETVTIEFILIDKVGASITKTIQLVVFENLPPVAVMDVSKIAQVDPFEIQLNANESFDRDAHFGGSVSAYEWEIDGVTFLTTDPISKYILGGTGSFIVTLRVFDNDSESSAKIVETFTL
ncbi:MAG: hypothetical protein GY816_17040 [Cytophagales bacterium]|nr:hypothetical protein [Cytophagales bacterium]